MRANEVLAAYAEYVQVAPILDVMHAALDTSNWDDIAWEAYSEQIAEIGSERALSGSLSAMSDATRIWRFQQTQRALHRFAEVAPMHAELAREYANTLGI